MSEFAWLKDVGLPAILGIALVIMTYLFYRTLKQLKVTVNQNQGIEGKQGPEGRPGIQGQQGLQPPTNGFAVRKEVDAEILRVDQDIKKNLSDRTTHCANQLLGCNTKFDKLNAGQATLEANYESMLASINEIKADVKALLSRG